MHCADSDHHRRPGAPRPHETGAAGVALALLLLGGCREIHTTTSLDADGSAERTIVVSTDAEVIGETGYPVPAPGAQGWSYELSRGDSTGAGEERPWVHAFTRRFRSARELGDEIERLASEGVHLRNHVELRRRHRWFSTYLRFGEVFEQALPYHHIPLSDYITPEELARIRSDDSSDEVDKRAEEWLERNIFEDLYLKMLEGVSGRQVPGLTARDLEARKEELFQAVVKGLEDSDLEAITDSILEIVGRLMKVKDTEPLRPAVEAFNEGFKQYEAISDAAGGESYINTVVMPGIIVDTNASEVIGNSVSWKFDPDDLNYGDLDMWVESRVANRAAFWLTAAFAAVLVALLVVSVVHRRRSSAMGF